MRILLRNLFVLALVAFAGSAFAQSPKQLMAWADESFADGDYYGASLYYEQAMGMDSTNIELLWKYAESLRLYNNYAKAVYYYGKVYKKERGKIYPESAFWLAVMQKNMGDYRGASKTWKKFNRKYKRDKKGYYFLKSKQEIESCKWARAALRDTSEIEVNNIQKPVNSYIAEFGGQVRDSVLYFSSLRAKKYGDNRVVNDTHYNIKIYQSEKKDGSWSEPEEIDTTVNRTGIHAANGVFSPDGKRFYFSRCNTLTHCEIWVSKYEDGRWLPAESLDEINDAGHNTTQPSVAISQGKEYLFYASDRSGGKGKLDIWFAEIKADGSLAKPRNAGDNINTMDNDITPFFHKGNLYFSSEWHNGFGGFDIQKAKGSPGDFGYPENLGIPFNSPANDYYFGLDSTGKEGLLSSNRLGSLFKKSPTCCNDIYTFEYPDDPDTVIITTLDDLNKYLPVTLYFHNDEPDPRTTKSTTKRNYIDTWDEYLQRREEYKTEYSKGLTGDEAEDAILDIEDFFEGFIVKGVKDLKLFSQLLLVELDKGQNIEITVQGFASPLAKTDYNVKLTGRRISSLVNFLRDYEAGRFVPYIDSTASNGGSLTFVRVPFGEYTADKRISSNPNESAESIFSIGAASERRIQIVSVKQARKDSAYAEMTFLSEIHDFGKSFVGDTLTAEYALRNTGNDTMRIDSIVTGYDFLTAVPSATEIAPGGEGKISITFIPGQDMGLQAYHFTIHTNAVPEEKRLSITTEVFLKE